MKISGRIWDDQSGWWWLEPWNFMTFPSYWEWKIIPTDVHSIIFQRGRSTTNQLGFETFHGGRVFEAFECAGCTGGCATGDFFDLGPWWLRHPNLENGDDPRNFGISIISNRNSSEIELLWSCRESMVLPRSAQGPNTQKTQVAGCSGSRANYGEQREQFYV